ncbi:MAG: DNA topoisomerase I [Candidatus Aenigmarchaeota archaeon]|nr:DNA topoisomerase I [Candidatus Aenigmarchaeota archaeon]
MGYTLIITEKPQAAKQIANALSDGSAKMIKRGGAYYFEFTRNGRKHFCVPAVGHLFILDTINTNGWNYPVFDLEWVPTHTKKDLKWTEKYYQNIQELAKKADDFIDAADYDTEGEVLLFNILKFICNKNDAKRMKFSTLTKSDIVDAYENVFDHIDFGQAEAGLTRHYLDAFWGFNTTRALTKSLNDFLHKGFTVVSTGRVQGPTLAILTKREIDIRNFKPTPFWVLELKALKEDHIIPATYEKERILDKNEAKRIFEACKNKDAKVKDIQTKKYNQLPPTPFDTTTLQTESYRCFGFSPTQTLSIAESLYTHGYISYPRTSSQKLPPKIGYKLILSSLGRMKFFEKEAALLLKKNVLRPKEGIKEDPAHPAIFPTAQTPNFDKLSQQEKKVYELVVRRFLATFGDAAVRESMKVVLDVNNHNFIANGVQTLSPGWTELYGRFVELKEETLPELKMEEILKVKELKMSEKKTQPPARYSQASVLKEMEKKELGTKATRASILQTLYDRGYIKGKSIEVTKFGEQVIKVLEEYSPKVISEELTRKFEEEMEMVNKLEKKREEVVEDAKNLLTDVMKDFKDNEKRIGEELSKAYITFKQDQKRIGVCPKCEKDLTIIVSRKSGKRFVGCSGYKDGCDFSTPLPQTGSITTTDKKCQTCGYPIIHLRFKGRRMIVTCINMKCPTKENLNNEKTKENSNNNSKENSS